MQELEKKSSNLRDRLCAMSTAHGQDFEEMISEIDEFQKVLIKHINRCGEDYERKAAILVLMQNLQTLKETFERSQEALKESQEIYNKMFNYD